MNRFLPPVLILAGTFAAAQSSSPLTSVLQRYVVKTSVVDGKTVESLSRTGATAQSKTVLQEELTLTNVSSADLGAMRIELPVPRNTEFIGGATPSTERWTLTYSADQGKTFTTQPTITVTVKENGQDVTKQVPAPLNRYTHARWSIKGLKAGESLKFALRVRVK